MRLLRADLHIHTALSPCGADEMTPAAIVATAMARGLDMIAVCDHNSAGNVRAVQEAGEAAGLVVLAGMELTSAEEVHIVGLFPDADHAEVAAARVRDLLPEADPGYYSFFGDQPVLAADGCRVGTETAALAWATPLELSDAVRLIHRADGLAIAAHIDRKAFSIFSQLGFVPVDAGFDGLEISKWLPVDSPRLAEAAAVGLIHDADGLAIAAHIDRKAFSVFSQLGFVPVDAGFDALEISKWLPADSPRLADITALGLALVGSSDGHFLEEIGQGLTELTAQAPTFEELALALRGTGGRGTVRVGHDPSGAESVLGDGHA
jgi:hypothetical protein